MLVFSAVGHGDKGLPKGEPCAADRDRSQAQKVE
jgi:hypothetical protein